MKNSPKLRDMQLWLKWVITDPRGVDEALTEPKPMVKKYQNRYIEPTESQLGHLESDSILRLNIYAEGYFSRILECMENDFPKTLKAIGNDTFTKLVAEYLKGYPSKYTAIDEIGRDFSKFISELEDMTVPAWTADLAQFEWKWMEAFYSETRPLKKSDGQSTEKKGDLSFSVHPSVQLIKSDWPLSLVIASLKALEDTNLIANLVKKPSGILIYRIGNQVEWTELELPLIDVLMNLKKDIPLDEALASATEVPLALISKLFKDWMEIGILSCVLNKGDLKC